MPKNPAKFFNEDVLIILVKAGDFNSARIEALSVADNILVEFRDFSTLECLGHDSIVNGKFKSARDKEMKEVLDKLSSQEPENGNSR